MLDYMIYIIAFAVALILGLLFSYKQHGEPYVANPEINMPAVAVSIIGWCWHLIQVMWFYPPLVFSLQVSLWVEDLDTAERKLQWV